MGCWLVFFPGGLLLSAAGVDESKLPPVAAVQIDFKRDIRPILEASCLRCHGPEKPKSRFRLDNREDALKGGENGVDILPGQSAKSPLIHYTSYLVADMEMPPPGKGERLTAQQVGLLRAWIDQGAAWDATPPTNNFAFSISPIFGGTAVSGDAAKFRELNWQQAGFNGGAGHFQWFEQADPNTKILLSGHALVDDYKLELSADRNELGFVHTGWEEYRKYYDDTGGYRPSPSTPSALSLGGDLHLDMGKAWVDLGLTLPNWPRMVLGYEYDYKQGGESTTSWGRLGQGGDARNIAPNTEAIHEGVQIIKFDLDAEVQGVAIEDRFRGEFYKLDTHYTNLAERGPVSQDVSEGTSYFQGANTIRLEKTFKDWLSGSAGYLYSRLNSDATFMDTVTSFSTPYVAAVPQITLERESHVFNVNGLARPFAGLTLSAGVQSEWTREQGLGSGNLNRIPFTFVAPLDLAINPATLSSDHDQNSVSESFAVRYSKLPFTVLFAEARLQQQSIGQSENDLQSSGSFLDNISFTSHLTDLRFGFSTSPWKTVSFSAHYRRYEDDSQYGNNQTPQPLGGYPGFIRARDLLTDEFDAKLVLHPAHWLKTTLSYQYLTTGYWTDTRPAFNAGSPASFSPGGGILSGQYDSRIYSINTTLTPCRRLCLGATFSYQTSTTITANNDLPAIAPYRGDIYSVLANCTYVLSQNMDLSAGYSFSAANYGQNNFTAGVPVGIEYRQNGVQIGLARRFKKNITAQLRYAYYNYNEPSSGGADNYVANSVFATVTFKLP
jgi:hypothetical protein